MVRSIGLDLVDTARIKNDIEKYGQKFIDRILSDNEKSLFEKRVDKAQFLSGRFAAKEAVIKGLGKFLTERPDYVKLEILSDSTGQPYLKLPDDLKENLNKVSCMLSITHEKNYAAAVAVFVEEV